MEKKNRMSFQ